jgi:hypothetical protein
MIVFYAPTSMNDIKNKINDFLMHYKNILSNSYRQHVDRILQKFLRHVIKTLQLFFTTGRLPDVIPLWKERMPTTANAAGSNR